MCYFLRAKYIMWVLGMLWNIWNNENVCGFDGQEHQVSHLVKVFQILFLIRFFFHSAQKITSLFLNSFILCVSNSPPHQTSSDSMKHPFLD